MIAAGESQHLEFKRHLESPIKAAQSLTALANTAGGWLLIGVEDNGEISGVQEPEAAIELIQTAACYYSDPPLSPTLLAVESRGSTIIAVELLDSPSKPHAVVSDTSKAKVYVRYGASNQPAGPALIRQLKSRGSAPTHYDYSPQEQALIQYLQDHSRVTLKAYCRHVNISERRAKRILNHLVQLGILNLFEHERETFYALAYSSR